MHRYRPRFAVVPLLLIAALAPVLVADEPIRLGTRRELFVDRFLIEKLDGLSLRLQHPQPAGVALKFDRPWEGQVSGYVTVIQDGDLYRMYYRGRPLTGYGDTDPRAQEVTCYAESRDGITFTRPKLGLIAFGGNKDNNAILADVGHVTHNFAPFLDTRPGVAKEERFKAVGGSSESGLIAYVSADGVHFRKLQDQPIITGGAFDSQNNILWSDHEQCYVCFFRTFRNGVRWITRTTSTDFLHWTPSVDMTFGDVPHEHLYTNQTAAYFRAPHIYIGTAARFWPGRRSLLEPQVAALKLEDKVNYGGLKLDSSDAVLLTSRGGDHFDRTFLESLVRPGADLKNWTCAVELSGPRRRPDRSDGDVDVRPAELWTADELPGTTDLPDRRFRGRARGLPAWRTPHQAIHLRRQTTYVEPVVERRGRRVRRDSGCRR